MAVLLDMNVSTPELRIAVAQAGALGNASRWSRSLYAFGILFYVGQALNVALWRTEPQWRWIPPAAAVEAFIMILGVQLLPRDRRPLAQFAQVLLLPFSVKFIPGVPAGGEWTDMILHGFVCPLIILIAFAGPSRTVRVPVLGPFMLRLLFGHNPCKRRQLERAGGGQVQAGGQVQNGSSVVLPSAVPVGEVTAQNAAEADGDDDDCFFI